MKAWIRIPLLVLAGLICAPLMEFGTMFWFEALPASMDLTGNYFLMVVLPVALVLHFLMALVLWKVFEPAPRQGTALFLSAHVVAQALLLNQFNNPPTDILIYCLVLIASGSAVLFVFNRYFWCQECMGLV